MLNSINYLIYLFISILITVYVSRTLSRNGLPFLERGLRGNRELAVATNHLLVVGFYLVNLGFVLLRMRTDAHIEQFSQLIVYQTSGIGLVLVVLGIAHFFNMYVIHQLGQSRFAYTYTDDAIQRPENSQETRSDRKEPFSR
ncbi:MAG: hypothetical protein AAF465_11860 [Pseudomonadota bacterium]